MLSVTVTLHNKNGCATKNRDVWLLVKFSAFMDMFWKKHKMARFDWSKKLEQCSEGTHLLLHRHRDFYHLAPVFYSFAYISAIKSIVPKIISSPRHISWEGPFKCKKCHISICDSLFYYWLDKFFFGFKDCVKKVHDRGEEGFYATKYILKLMNLIHP